AVSASAVAVAQRDAYLVLGVPLDVVLDERAERDDLEARVARVLERRLGKRASEPAPLAGRGDLRVRQGNPAVVAVVGGDGDRSSVEPQLVTRLVGNVHDLGLLGGDRRVNGLLTRPEVLYELVRRVRLACVSMVGEALAMRLRVVPPAEGLQIAEDRPCPREELPVLSLKRR